MQLSQGHLTVLDYCPRRFQYVYLDQLATPLTPDQQEAIATGQRFHLLMQQYELGVLPEPLPTQADPVYTDVARFLEAAPDLFRSDSQSDPAQFRQSEHRRYLQRQSFCLTVIYDLLILEAEHATILDWKTHWQAPRPQSLEQNWQLKLYPYVLAETSHYRPDQISMTYWFVRSRTTTQAGTEIQPTALRFAYTGDRHHQIQQELDQRLTLLHAYLQDYQQGRSLPQVAESSGRCLSCPFATRCQRTTLQPSEEPNLLTIGEIREVSL